MKLKDYSMRIKKNIAVLLHSIFLTLTVGGISAIYLNTQVGSGLSWLRDRSYDESPQFQEQFQSDLDLIFRYVTYRDVFETDQSLDLSREMFSVSRGDGPGVIYTLEEVLRYAKSQGFYLNDQFDVVNDLFIYDNASTAKDQKVEWRAYEPDTVINEPGDAMVSLLDLSREVLDCLSVYYKVTYRMIANPSNLYFHIAYIDEDSGEPYLVDSNAGDLTLDQLRGLGRYCYLDNTSAVMDTNLKEIPKNVARAMEQNNIYDADAYYMIAAVDTDFTADDLYADQAAAYSHLTGRCTEALFGLVVGILGCLVTLYYLTVVSGYRTEERVNPYLHGFDMITTESCVAMTVICTAFALFLGEKVGYKLIHLLVQSETWPFAERMMRAVIVYTCCMVGGFSLLRRYKSRQLWENSILHHLAENINQYFADRTYTHRLFCLFTGFVAVQAAGIGTIAFLIRILGPVPMALIVLVAAGLVYIDYQAFHKLFITSRQEDRIAEAISKIAGGDTGYQMDLNGLTGKELQIGRQVNRIGTGLEKALQEQVKSERLKADLITNVSHDIKTPLTSIINYVDLLKRENLPGDRVKQYLGVLDQKSQRLKNLTEDLLEASKASSGSIKLEMTTIDLVEMIWQTNGEFEEKFAERGLELVSTLPDSAVLIDADGRHLWRVLENLYNNAFKYAMEHSRVFTDLVQEQGWVYFTIKNISSNPINIQGEELTERFVRGDVSRTTEGSGLGLSIAQSLTKLQGGVFDIIVEADLFKVRIGFPVKAGKEDTQGEGLPH